MPRFVDRLLRHRPSAPMLVALLALFVALGGPAQAARVVHEAAAKLKRGSVGSTQVKDRSLQVRDLSRKAVRTLQRTPKGSITQTRIRNGAVTPGKLATAAVGSSAIADRAVQGGDIGLGAVGGLEVADNSLTGADVADGGLDARDVARFWGRFTIAIGPIDPGKCWQGDPVGLAPERSSYDISGDVIQVTPSAGWPDTTPPGSLTFATRASTTRSRFTVMACNLSDVAIGAPNVSFNYAIVDVP
jgi:hypothetical protein